MTKRSILCSLFMILLISMLACTPNGMAEVPVPTPSPTPVVEVTAAPSYLEIPIEEFPAEESDGAPLGRIGERILRLHPAFEAALQPAAGERVEFERYLMLPDGSIIAYVGKYNDAGWLCGERFLLEPDGANFTILDHKPEDATSEVYTLLDLSSAHDYDLNGDGVAERIRFQVDEAAETFSFTVDTANGQYVDAFEYLYNVQIYLADTVLGDGKQELYVTGDVASSDYLTWVYCLEADELVKTELRGMVMNVIDNGRVVITRQTDVLGTSMGLQTLFTEDAKTFYPESDQSIYVIPGFSEIQLKRDGLPVIDSLGNELRLSIGDKLLILYSDETSYALVELDDGNICTLALDVDTEAWGYKLDGRSQDEWFTELFYAG